MRLAAASLSTRRSIGIGSGLAATSALPRSRPIDRRRRGSRPSSSSKVSAGKDSDLMSNLLRNLLGQQKQPNAAGTSSPSSIGSQVSFVDEAPSWKELESRVETLSEKLDFSPLPDLENGARANAMSLRRMFGTTSEPRVKLYRDHAAWCPYCQKVWLQLEEKKIPYVVRKENMRCYGPKTREYLSLVPSGLLPALELDGKFYTESAVIMDLLEAAFPDNKPLVPDATADPAAAARHSALLRLERRLFGDWLDWLVRPWDERGSREQFFSTLGVVEDALAAPGGPGSAATNRKPTEGPYFMGDDVSMADLVFAPFLERIAASIPYYKGVRIRGDRERFPALNSWFDAMETRESYLGTKSDVYTHVHDLPPQLGGCAAVDTPERREAAAAVDGTDGESWRLPLASKPLKGDGNSSFASFDEWPGEDPQRDRLRAAARLVSNRDAIVRFAARGAPGSTRGDPPVTAPLADPFAVATDEEAALGAVDAALRSVASAMLDGHDGSVPGPEVVSTPAEGGVRALFPALPAAASAAYLRDRVGVPRDLPLPAARQLRAHLNWFIDAVSASV